MQLASRLMLVRPAGFGYNEETAFTNAFQKKPVGSVVQEEHKKAVNEFDNFVEQLKANDLKLDVFEDEPGDPLPDSVFPNNWISFHENNLMIIYPMYAESRRREKRKKIIDFYGQLGYVSEDWSKYESKNRFLEGTGSMVLDRDRGLAYACLSQRTNKKLVKKFCRRHGYKSYIFEAYDHQNVSIYHTNVMMSVGEDLAVIAGKAIRDPGKRAKIFNVLEKSGKEVINLSFEQLNCFAGNILQVRNSKNEKKIIISKQGFDSLYKIQIKKMQKHGRFIVAGLDTIERLGGGSARCMLAEVF